MAAHLTLIVDNSAQGDAPAVEPGTTGATGSADSPGLPESWVHRAWRPTAARRLQSSPVFGPRRIARPLRSAEVRSRSLPCGVRKLVREDRGAVTAEYAIVIMAAVAFAGLLVAIMRSGEIRQMLVDLVQNALGMAG